MAKICKLDAVGSCAAIATITLLFTRVKSSLPQGPIECSLLADVRQACSFWVIGVVMRTRAASRMIPPSGSRGKPLRQCPINRKTDPCRSPLTQNVIRNEACAERAFVP
jgi:hypothetical protein